LELSAWNSYDRLLSNVASKFNLRLSSLETHRGGRDKLPVRRVMTPYQDVVFAPLDYGKIREGLAADCGGAAAAGAGAVAGVSGGGTMVGRCRLSVSKPVLKARLVSARAWFQRLKRNCDEQLSKVAFNFKVRRYTMAAGRVRRVVQALRWRVTRSAPGHPRRDAVQTLVDGDVLALRVWPHRPSLSCSSEATCGTFEEYFAGCFRDTLGILQGYLGILWR